MEAAKKRILVIEDDPAIADVLEYNLTREGYAVAVAGDGRAALAEATARVPDLVVLDLMLPGMDGVEICRRMRAETALRTTPILMLTAKSEEIDQIVGFSVGADDYVTKPFSVKVLLQRLRVLLTRRQASAHLPPRLEAHGLAIDRIAHEATAADQALPLTPTEFRILEALMSQVGRAFSRSDLMSAAIGDDTIVLERTVDVHIRALRAKLGERANLIETVRGIGYRFAREA
jgi:DNA-binding response OmpR family regulator